MRYLLLFALLLFSCEKDPNNDIITEFINEFYLSQNYDINNLNNYMTSSYLSEYEMLDTEKKEAHYQYLKAFIDDIRDQFQEHKSKYKIVSSDDLESKLLEGKTINYKGSGKVQYLLLEDNTLISFFILERDKILAFCPDIYNYKEGKITPYFFFREVP